MKYHEINAEWHFYVKIFPLLSFLALTTQYQNYFAF